MPVPISRYPLQSIVVLFIGAFAIYSESAAEFLLQVEASVRPGGLRPISLRSMQYESGNYPTTPIAYGHPGESVGHCGRRYH
jgi:hypothetical protein